MKSIDDCFIRVKKKCFKFIKSQETLANKFKNKDRMLKSYLIPLCFWISKKTIKKRPLIIGVAGGQGTGKTTITSILSLILRIYFMKRIISIRYFFFFSHCCANFLSWRFIYFSHNFYFPPLILIANAFLLIPRPLFLFWGTLTSWRRAELG